ncbi:MAG: outer membrane receptor protein involved in Fe transport [Flavobacteriales bacterium]|jgi:outer membrane receptor protein involved in Fe transport
MIYKTLFALCIFASTTLWGQQYAGTVVNQFNEPVQDVRIESLNSQSHIHTSFDGKFNLEIDSSIADTIIFEKVGYQLRIIPVSNILDSEIIIKMYATDVRTLDNVIISSKKNVVNEVANIDLNTNANRSSQELLTLVPGLFVAKHAGGGKSDQMFLRGFDLDHGTDIGIYVDNTPVNMVSHAHGQGYTDLHFVIPNLIDKIEFAKGPYDITKGNFTTAGHVNFITKTKIENNEISFDYGMFNTKKVSGAFKLIEKENHNLYLALSSDQRDGYFESSQRFKRNNLMAKYTGMINPTTQLMITGNYFNSSWDASGQIPLRAVNSGTITRFGAIDNTEGGATKRAGLQLGITKYFEDSKLTTSVYAHVYDFELYSNFTFFARDSINGDQIRQKENRSTTGFNSDYIKTYNIGKVEIDLLAGAGTRMDRVDNIELSYTKNRSETLEHVKLGNIFETNTFTYLGADIEINKWRINGGIRAENINNEYEDLLAVSYNPQTIKSFALLPKAAVNYQLFESLSLNAKYGIGFHSNDTRLVMEDPKYLEIPEVHSSDIGFDYSPLKNLFFSASAWLMKSEQEFVYVGDEGIVEPSGSTTRKGIDLSATYQLSDFAFFNVNANYSHARTDEENGYIPLAVPFTSNASLKVKISDKISGTWNSRLMSNRPGDETNTAQLNGYFINDFNVSWNGKNLLFQLSIDNIFNVDWEETQFITESRLSNENLAVTETHFTPGEPRFIKGRITYRF